TVNSATILYNILQVNNKHRYKPLLLGNSLGSSHIRITWSMPIMISWGNSKSLNCSRGAGGVYCVDIVDIAVTMDAYSDTIGIRIVPDIQLCHGSRLGGPD
ncbi:uncharacterized protein Bfra_000554, partial [Botrytis fragariae]